MKKISDKNFKFGEKTCKKRKNTRKSEISVSMATTQNWIGQLHNFFHSMRSLENYLSFDTTFIIIYVEIRNWEHSQNAPPPTRLSIWLRTGFVRRFCPKSLNWSTLALYQSKISAWDQNFLGLCDGTWPRDSFFMKKTYSCPII